MRHPVNRRSFMKIAGSTLGIGVLYTALPLPAAGEAGEMMRWLGKQNGEQMTPFSFVQRCACGIQRATGPAGNKSLRAGDGDDQRPPHGARPGPVHG